MSSSSLSTRPGSKKKAVSSAEAGATKDGGSDDGSKHKRMRLEDINDDDCDDNDQKPAADPRADLELTLKRKAQAPAGLDASHHAIEKAGQDIRARGEAEFDSLLAVGNDSVLHILGYFDVKQLCQCERICKAFQMLSAETWKDLDKKSGPHKSIVADSQKSRCMRYVCASEYASRVDGLASRHSYSYKYRNAQCPKFVAASEGWPVEAAYPGVCGLPDELAMVDDSDRELFLRISFQYHMRDFHPDDVLMEGFFPIKSVEHRNILGVNIECLCLDLCHARCPNWPEMESLLSRQRFERGERESWWNREPKRVESFLKDAVTVTLVSLNDSNEPSLVASVDNFDLVKPSSPAADPWLEKVSGDTPFTPHSKHAKKRQIEFGWSRKSEVIGFCLSITVAV